MRVKKKYFIRFVRIYINYGPALATKGLQQIDPLSMDLPRDLVGPRCLGLVRQTTIHTITR